MENNERQLIKTVRRVSEAEKKAEQMIKELIWTGVDTLKYDREKGKIVSTRKDNGIVNTSTSYINNIGQRMELTQTNTNDKETRNEYIVELCKEGYSQNDIAKITGLSQPMIHAILKAAGAL